VVKEQSSFGLPVLPPFRLLLATLLLTTTFPTQGFAQRRYRVATDENLRLEPVADAPLLARVNAETEMRGDEERGGWVHATLEGWIWAASTRSAGSGDFDLRVIPPDGENLRAEPNGRVVARLQSGTLLNQAARRGDWIQVRRAAWIWGRSLSALDAPVTSTPPPSVTPTSARPALLDRYALPPGTRMFGTPNGDTVGALVERAPARVLARTDGWARVLVEAWVRDDGLTPADDSVLEGITAAEVRGSGAAYVGRTLRWTVELIAVQVADELRKEIAAGQRYMLARGPLPELGFVYILLTDTQAAAVAQLQPLTRLTILGRVRMARSRYLGNPVLDLVEFAVDKQP
jgi:hypothetical protein